MESTREGMNTFLGVPFVSPEFDAAAARVAVTHVRAVLDGYCDDDDGFERYLRPLDAYRVARQNHASHPSLDAAPLTPAEANAVRQALEDVRYQVPSWGELLSLPVHFLRVANNDIYSLTNPVIPQMIFLGRQAMDSPEDLRETLVHELAHVWMGLLHEIHPLVHEHDRSSHILPSGTTGKSSLGVVLAAHFAAAAASFHLRSPADRWQRISFLRAYLRDCLPLLGGHPALTSHGRMVWDLLTAFSVALDRLDQEPSVSPAGSGP